MGAVVTQSPRRKSDKIMRDAILLSLNRTEDVNGEQIKRIYLVADKLVRKAIDGDVPAIREVADRIDGKVKQALTIEDEREPSPADAIDYGALTAEQREALREIAQAVVERKRLLQAAIEDQR